MADGEFSLLSKYWEEILLLVGLAASWIRMEYKTEMLDKMVVDQKTRKPNMVFVEDCQNKMQACQKRVLEEIQETNRKIDSFNDTVKEIHKRIDDTNKKITHMPQEIINLLLSAGKIQIKD